MYQISEGSAALSTTLHEDPVQLRMKTLYNSAWRPCTTPHEDPVQLRM